MFRRTVISIIFDKFPPCPHLLKNNSVSALLSPIVFFSRHYGLVEDCAKSYEWKKAMGSSVFFFFFFYRLFFELYCVVLNLRKQKHNDRVFPFFVFVLMPTSWSLSCERLNLRVFFLSSLHGDIRNTDSRLALAHTGLMPNGKREANNFKKVYTDSRFH